MGSAASAHLQSLPAKRRPLFLARRRPGRRDAKALDMCRCDHASKRIRRIMEPLLSWYVAYKYLTMSALSKSSVPDSAATRDNEVPEGKVGVQIQTTPQREGKGAARCARKGSHTIKLQGERAA